MSPWYWIRQLMRSLELCWISSRGLYCICTHIGYKNPQVLPHGKEPTVDSTSWDRIVPASGLPQTPPSSSLDQEPQETGTRKVTALPPPCIIYYYYSTLTKLGSSIFRLPTVRAINHSDRMVLWLVWYSFHAGLQLGKGLKWLQCYTPGINVSIVEYVACGFIAYINPYSSSELVADGTGTRKKNE